LNNHSPVTLIVQGMASKPPAYQNSPLHSLVLARASCAIFYSQYRESPN
jgi:hypothetical protein